MTRVPSQLEAEIIAELKTLMGHEFNRSKRWWVASYVLQIVATTLVSGAAFVKDMSVVVAVLGIGSVPLAAFACRWYGDAVRGAADDMLRKVEYLDFFGGPVRARELADALASAAVTKAQVRALEKRVVQPAWATAELAGKTRALKNVRESAWWSHHLSRTHFQWALAASILLGLASLAYAIVVFNLAIPADQRSAISKTFLGIVSIAITGGFVKLAADYAAFAAGCQRVVESCERLLASAASEADALRLVSDYQLRRSKAPPLLTLVHAQRQEELNARWRDVENIELVPEPSEASARP